MTLKTEKLDSECNYWSKEDDSQWLTDITSNLLLAIAFSVSYFIEEPWIWIRLLLIFGHAIAGI